MGTMMRGSIGGAVKTMMLAIGAALALASCAPPADKSGPEQLDRIRAVRDAQAIALLPEGHKFAQPGVLRVATGVGQLPLADYRSDGTTIVGVESDLAQLVADSLGLKLDLVPVAWPDWPLGLESGKYDAAISNITVTEQRKLKFDFSTYRDDQLGIYTRAESPIKHIAGPADIAGLKVAVGASTNQSQILDRWNDQNRATGLQPATPLYYDDTGLSRLAVLSARADISFGPNAIAAYEARDGKTRQVGAVSGGWPLTAEIAVATRKGSGLAEAITHALNTQIANGNYGKVLARWNLTSEAISKSRTNPPGLP